MLKDQLKLIYESKQTTPVQMTLHMIHSNGQTNSTDPNPANMVKFKTSAYAFCNPCNDAFEFIVCTHQCVNRPLQQSNDPLALNPNTNNNNNNSTSTSSNSNLLMNNQPMNTNLLASNLTSLQPASGTHLLGDSSTAYTNAANQPQYHTLSGQYSHLSQSNWSSNPSPLTGQVHSVTNNSPPTSAGSADQSAPYASNYILMPGKYQLARFIYIYSIAFSLILTLINCCFLKQVFVIRLILFYYFLSIRRSLTPKQSQQLLYFLFIPNQKKEKKKKKRALSSALFNRIFKIQIVVFSVNN